MDKNKICEELYALPGNRIVKRRKPILIPLLLMLTGAALLLVNALLVDAEAVNLKSALVFLGGATLLTATLMMALRLFGGDGIPFCPACGKYLLYEELYFDRSKLREVMTRSETVDVKGLRQMESQSVPMLAVTIFRTPDDSFAACQVFEYVELEYRPLCGLRVAL